MDGGDTVLTRTAAAANCPLIYPNAVGAAPAPAFGISDVTGAHARQLERGGQPRFARPVVLLGLRPPLRTPDPFRTEPGTLLASAPSAPRGVAHGCTHRAKPG